MERATASSVGENIILDNAYDATAVQVESGTSSVGNIILNGTDSSKTDDGVKLEMEAYHDVAACCVEQLPTPYNWTLNADSHQTSTISQIVRPPDTR